MKVKRFPLKTLQQAADKKMIVYDDNTTKLQIINTQTTQHFQPIKHTRFYKKKNLI